MRGWLLGIALAAACGGARPEGAADRDAEPARASTVERAFTLWWRGARVGDARERERWDAGGLTLERRERVRVRRGGALEATDTAIDIRADRALVASRVDWREDVSDGATHAGHAIRTDRGWRIDVDGEPARTAPAGAVPEELVPLIVRRDGGFRGDQLLTGRGFALAHGDVTRAGDAHLRASIATDAGAMTAEIITDRDGDALSITASDGVVARRAAPAELAAAFDPPEVVDGAAIAIRGELRAGAVTLRLDAIDRTPPPALPGQRVAANAATWRIALAPADDDPTGDRSAEIAALAASVFAADDGDCTAHALAFVARAAADGIATRVVTGWRVDDARRPARLVRHRWAIAWTGAAWIAVDPSYGEAPAAPRLVGLATSGATAAELALADLAFAGTEGATAQVTR